MHKSMKLLSDYAKKLRDEQKHQTLDKFVKPITPSAPSEVPKDRGIIAVDQRETNSAVVKHLYTLGFEVDLRQLQIADYVVGDVAIERKTTEDFVQSLLNCQVPFRLHTFNIVPPVGPSTPRKAAAEHAKRLVEGLLHFGPRNNPVDHSMLQEKLRSLKTLREIFFDGLLNHARPGKANQGIWLRIDHIPQHRAGGSNPTGGGVR